MNYIEHTMLADHWIERHTIDHRGIAVHSKDRRIYPEVTGYYIPSLLRWGYRELAFSYAEYLCTIQQENGAWCAADKKTPYVFDTGQILKGLLAVYPFMPQVKDSIIKGCEWMISNMQEDGRLTTPSTRDWGKPGTCSELIHLYCLSPLMDAAKEFDRIDFSDNAKRILNYYLENHMEEIMNFNLLSHFYAYIIEALIDLGEHDIACRAMDRIEKIQNPDGSVPAYRNVTWICSTGVFQFAVIWYRLGRHTQGDRAFNYAIELQNSSGGWYGGYPHNGRWSKFSKYNEPDYFPHSEPSWVVKYFLDAFYYKLSTEFEGLSDTFLSKIRKKDGRYRIIRELMEKQLEKGCEIKAADIGCGKGRYLKNLSEDVEGVRLYGVDMSSKVMNRIQDRFEVRQGSLLCIPYPDETFDVVYTVEALEHAVHISNAVKELVRVTKNGGILVVIDKNRNSKINLRKSPWEQWFDGESLAECFRKMGCGVRVIENIDYEGKKDGLFHAWVMEKHRTSAAELED